MDLSMISQLLGETRAEMGGKGPLPTAKEFPGQIPTPENVTESKGLLDPNKVVDAMGDAPKMAHSMTKTVGFIPRKKR